MARPLNLAKMSVEALKNEMRDDIGKIYDKAGQLQTQLAVLGLGNGGDKRRVSRREFLVGRVKYRT